MNMLASLATQDDIATEKDSVGGGSRGPVDSGIYNCTVALAYLKKADSGALGLVLHLKTEDDREIRQTLWMTSGTAKGGKNYYEKDGQKHYLPGFTHANALALLTTGKEISQLDTETKVVNMYSFDVKAEVPTKVDVLMDLMNKEIIAGVIKQTVDKNVKDAAGNYVPSGETRDENEIDKFFRAKDRMTTAEIRAQAEEAVFIETWRQKWEGKTKDRAKGAAGGLAGVPKLGGAPAAAATKKPTTSLFG